MRLTEDLAKARLAAGGVAVPRGHPAVSPQRAQTAALALGGRVMVKALVPANRRGKAGGVLGPLEPDAVPEAARTLLGASVAGFQTGSVYVEEWLPLASELFLAFTFSPSGPIVTASTRGGVDVEAVADLPGLGILPTTAIDPLTGLSIGEARELWQCFFSDLARSLTDLKFTMRFYQFLEALVRSLY